jgi:hypothetical protein
MMLWIWMDMDGYGCYPTMHLDGLYEAEGMSGMPEHI